MQTPSLYQIKQKVTPSEMKSVTILRDYDTNAIIRLLIDKDKIADTFTREIAQNFKGRTVEETAYNIWKFLRENIRYKEDGRNQDQLLKSPSALVHSGFGDCKSYSLFTGSILRNLGIPYSYRFVSEQTSGVPHHVYVVAYDGGKEIVIDAVNKGAFNTEARGLTSKSDIRGGLGALSYMAGLGGVTRKKAFWIGGLSELNGLGDFGTRPQLTEDDFYYSNFTQRAINWAFFTGKIERQLIEAAPAFLYIFSERSALPPAAQAKYDAQMALLAATLKKTNLKYDSALNFLKKAVEFNTGKTVEALMGDTWAKYIAYRKPYVSKYYGEFSTLKFPTEPVKNALNQNYANDMVAWEAAKRKIVQDWGNSYEQRAIAAGLLTYEKWVNANKIAGLARIGFTGLEELSAAQWTLIIGGVIGLATAIVYTVGDVAKLKASKSDFPTYVAPDGSNGGGNTTTPPPSTDSFSLSSIPTPVKVIGTGLIVFGLIYALAD